jgi:hypothetical protein
MSGTGRSNSSSTRLTNSVSMSSNITFQYSVCAHTRRVKLTTVCVEINEEPSVWDRWSSGITITVAPTRPRPPYSDAKVANRNFSEGLARRQRKVNDGQIPNVRIVRV